ncbi:MAG: hypothetical protein U0136_04110 [Bdellovibrionota bacterium]
MAVDSVGASSFNPTQNLPVAQASGTQASGASDGLNVSSPLNLPPPAANDDPAVRLSLSGSSESSASAAPLTYTAQGKPAGQLAQSAADVDPGQETTEAPGLSDD